MPADTRKPRPKPKPYKRQPKTKVEKNLPATSAKPAGSNSRSILTLADWMTVYAFVDAHPDLPQGQVVEHFKTRPEGALEFTQSTLSRKLKARSELKDRVHANPNALSGKRARIVTRPDVEKALVLWVRHMEEKGETVNGPMLREKRKRFEDELNVPQNERLTGEGWLAPFCKAYKIKEFRRHGEAGSVDLNAVARERARVQKILSTFPSKDRWNFDESSLFAFAPPDRGLATKQMSGKKKDKFRITLAFAVNADGSERMPVFYIGRSKKPRCFGNKTPQARGFYYRNNKKAWMTSELFEEWIKLFDMKMGAEKRFVCLLIDNFSGHNISYEPRHVQLEFFEPNLTSFVQPLDAGIIRCFKAHYRRAFCNRAIDLDEAGERDIYKINILEAMLMAKEAWDAVEPSTIKHCWDHTGIQADSPDIEAPSSHPAHSDPVAWSIIREFANDDNMSLPAAEKRLAAHLGARYTDDDWHPALKAVMDAERDAVKANEAVERLAAAALRRTGLTLKIPARPQVQAPQLVALEKDLMDSVENLKNRKRIIGQPPTVDEILAPVEEKEVGDSVHRFEGGDTAIVAEAQRQLAVERGEVIEVDSDDEDDEDKAPVLSHADLTRICEQLEVACISYGDSESSLDLSRHLRRFRALIRHDELMNARQTTLNSFWQQ
ncbi:DDE-domain-containing protein [Leucogyrophana mollusca]|uniref:DDE-domain-containing protein n=1 Tax=Leucogyrophana mollusca TaxID=85980 RepID=A0ACB8BWM8_9AGAM|nr:DDE-domain-containing protein [Leucogyrophana mollusca]